MSYNCVIFSSSKRHTFVHYVVWFHQGFYCLYNFWLPNRLLNLVSFDKQRLKCDLLSGFWILNRAFQKQKIFFLIYTLLLRMKPLFCV